MNTHVSEEVVGARGGGLERLIDGLLTDTQATDVVPSGFRDLDDLLSGGLRRGQMAVVMGVPGVGTSTFAFGVARNAALRYGLPSLFMAPDSSDLEIRTRLISAETKIPANHIRTGRINDDEQERLRRRRSALEAAPLIVSAGWLKAGPTRVDDAVRDYARLVDVVVLDSAPADDRTVSGLKVVAQQFNIALVVTTKAALGQDPTRPRLSQLRGPESLAELADLILRIHREDMIKEESTRPGEADIEILKHRYGPTRQLPPIAFQGHYSRFVDAAS